MTNKIDNIITILMITGILPFLMSVVLIGLAAALIGGTA